MTAHEVIPRIVASSGLTQGEFARRLGTSPSRMSTYVTGRSVPSADLLLRMYALARAAATEGRGWPTAAQTAAHVQGALDANDGVWAFRLLLQARDLLGRLTPEERREWARRAPRIEDERWSTLFHALVTDAYAQGRWGRPPAWAVVTRLPGPWTPIPVLREAPGPFDHLNIRVPARDLVTA